MAQTELLSKRSGLIAVGVAAVIVLALLALFFVGDAPDEVDLGKAVDVAEQPAGDDPPLAEGADDVDPQGTWEVDTFAVPFSFDDSTGTFLGFRIDEELTQVGKTTAVGRTQVVTGTMTIDGQLLTAASFQGDLSDMFTDRSQRNNRVRQALHTANVPFATFTLSEPLDLGGIPSVGEQIRVAAVGQLQIYKTTLPVVIPLEASLSSTGILVVTSSFDVALADYGIDKPEANVVVSIADVATVEVQLYLVKAGQ